MTVSQKFLLKYTLQLFALSVVQRSQGRTVHRGSKLQAMNGTGSPGGVILPETGKYYVIDYQRICQEGTQRSKFWYNSRGTHLVSKAIFS